MAIKEIKRDKQWLARLFVILVLDVFTIAGSFFAALWVRYEFRVDVIPDRYIDTLVHYIGYWVVVCVLVFWLADLYNSIWTYVSIDSLARIMVAYVALLVLAFVGVKGLMPLFGYLQRFQ